MKYTISPKVQIDESKKIIELILKPSNNIHIDMQRKVIDFMLWNITGAFGKLHTRYISEGAKTSRDEPLRHEHVFTKKSLIQRILNEQGNLDTILNNAIGCVVTKKEHDILHAIGTNVVGWDRYITAKIKVWELDEDILYRQLPGMKKGDIMNLPYADRIKILDLHTTQCDLEKLANNLAV